jgi:hypothetical protein
MLTAKCLALLCVARMVVATLPFSLWRHRLGGSSSDDLQTAVPDARRLASHVEWAARLLPITTKCLPRAMVLSWLLRSKKIAHCLVFAVRPADRRDENDQLHSWVEVGSRTIMGTLPGPWVETLRLGDGGRQEQANLG